MMRQWYSVDQVAELLGLHVKTVRGYIRDGRLPAVRVGKQYRISRADLAELTGEPTESVSPRHVEVSSVVRIEAIGRESMSRLTGMVMASLRDEPGGGPLHVETVYDEDRASLKIIVDGGASRTAELLGLVDAIVEQV